MTSLVPCRPVIPHPNFVLSNAGTSFAVNSAINAWRSFPFVPGVTLKQETD
jgi:hypothetical protein